ncbi:MAG: 3-oxoadipate enol-lactonase [Moraxella sp.]|nr:3-oxoadipate enol-lactonase [Moraxella sp.]
MSYVASPRGRIFYQAFGSATKPALIFSNSLGTDHTMWQSQINALQDDFYIIAYDTRGHGQSDTPERSYTLDDLGADVLDVLNDVGAERAHFCGISMGGLIGQWLGIHSPKRLNKLIISNTAAKIGTADGWRQRASLVREQGLGEIAATAATRWFTDEFVLANPHVVNELSAKLTQGSSMGYAACCEALGVADLRDDIHKISVPTLVVAGSGDPITTVDDAKWLQAHINGAGLAILNASHIANIEADTEFTQVVRDFLLV